MKRILAALMVAAVIGLTQLYRLHEENNGGYDFDTSMLSTPTFRDAIKKGLSQATEEANEAYKQGIADCEAGRLADPAMLSDETYGTFYEQGWSEAGCSRDSPQ